MEKYVAPIILIVIIAGYFYFRGGVSSESAKENIKIGDEFLSINKTVDGVQQTPSGLQYLVLSQGTGEIHPKSRDKVRVHYHGTLLDDTVFDSSVDRGEPISFGLNQVIAGWTEGLQLMVVGEKTRFFIPSHLAYGNRATGKITAGSLLIFDVELFGINE